VEHPEGVSRKGGLSPFRTLGASAVLELGSEPARRQERWQAFLMDADPNEEAIRRQDWLLGEAALMRKTQDRSGHPAGRGRGRPARLCLRRQLS
jgi:hypothetical protein